MQTQRWIKLDEKFFVEFDELRAHQVAPFTGVVDMGYLPRSIDDVCSKDRSCAFAISQQAQQIPYPKLQAPPGL